MYVRITGLVSPDMARKKQDVPKLLFVLFTDHMTACTLCCGGGGAGGGGGGGVVKVTTSCVSPAAQGVGAALRPANHLASWSLCLGKRPLPGLNY